MVGILAILSTNGEGLRCLVDRAWIHKLGDLRQKVLEEAYKSKYRIHPGTNKMYRDLHQNFWWPGLKKDIAHFVEQCVTYLQVKAEH